MAKFKQGDRITLQGIQGEWTVQSWPDNNEGPFTAAQFGTDGGVIYHTGWAGQADANAVHEETILAAAAQGDVPDDLQKISTNEVIPDTASVNTPIPLATEPLEEDVDVPDHYTQIDGEGNKFEKPLTGPQRRDLTRNRRAARDA